MTDNDARQNFFSTLEKTVEQGMTRLAEQNAELTRNLAAQNVVLNELRERSARMEVEIRQINETKDEVKDLKTEVNTIKQSRAMERGIMIGGGGLLGWLASMATKVVGG
jgi:predicted RNase H-like nuclease (RuvC/YqgF family)